MNAEESYQVGREEDFAARELEGLPPALRLWRISALSGAAALCSFSCEDIMAQIVQIAGVEFMTAGENRTAVYLQEKLPADWVVVCNKELVTCTGFAVEVDFIIIGAHTVFIAEEKSWRGRIHGDENHWVLSDGERRIAVKNTLLNTRAQMTLTAESI